MIVLLSMQGIKVRFGGVVALDGVSLDVAAGSIHSIVGANGAGKTTLFNAVSGVYRPYEGSIRFRNRELVGLWPSEIARAGISRTFQNVELFPELTVLENVMMGAEAQEGLWRGWSRQRLLRERAKELLAELGLSAYEIVHPDRLPFGIRKTIELARATMSAPALIMLDEPTAGLQAGEMRQLPGLLERLRSTRGITFAVIAHHMEFVMQVSDVVSVLHLGRKIAEGHPKDVAADPVVRNAYLGLDVEG